MVSSTDRFLAILSLKNRWGGPLLTICRFSWANGLFGQMILDLAARKPHILQQSFQ
jgi:hypothetical protein